MTLEDHPDEMQADRGIDVLRDLVALFAIALITTGVALIHAPVAFIVAGALLLAGCLYGASQAKRRRRLAKKPLSLRRKRRDEE